MNGTVSNKLLDKLNNKLVRNFKTTSINQEWVTDISEFKIASGKLYLSPVIDIYTNEIINIKLKGLTPVEYRNQTLQLQY